MKPEIRIVIGANAGDEGKGNVTARLCRSEAAMAGRNETAALFQNEAATLGILTNGGPQRGHTVVDHGRRHVFSHFTSGTFAGAATYCGPDYIINPLKFLSEYEELVRMGVTPVVYVDYHCRFTTPYDMMLNQSTHQSEGTHHTCGMGIWETYIRYLPGAGGVTIGDFAMMSETQRYLAIHQIRQAAQVRMRETFDKDLYERWADIVGSETLERRFLQSVDTMLGLVHLCEEGIMHQFGRLVFENGQGLLLNWSDDEEDMVYTTPSFTGLDSPMGMIERNFAGADVDTVYVTRTYVTRHGDGPLEKECHKEEIGRRLIERTNATNEFQGRFRYAKLEVESLHDRIAADFAQTRGAKNHYRRILAMTHADEALPSDELMHEAGSFDDHMLIGQA